MQRIVMYYEGKPVELWLAERYPTFKALSQGTDFTNPVVPTKA